LSLFCLKYSTIWVGIITGFLFLKERGWAELELSNGKKNTAPQAPLPNVVSTSVWKRHTAGKNTAKMLQKTERCN
jgi:hypothetical protein